jgi:hypothetical protein
MGPKRSLLSLETKLTYRNNEPKDNSSVIVNVNVTPRASTGKIEVLGKVGCVENVDDVEDAKTTVTSAQRMAETVVKLVQELSERRGQRLP